MPYTHVHTLSPTNFYASRFSAVSGLYPPEVTLSEDEVKDLNKYTMRFYDEKSSTETIPPFTPPQAFTVDLIAKLYIPSEQNAVIFNLAGLGYWTPIDLMGMVYGNNYIALMRNNSVLQSVSMTAPFIGEWHRYTVEWNSNVIKFYFDGVLMLTAPWPIPPELFPTAGQTIHIGGANNPSLIDGEPAHINRNLNADIVQFRVFDGPATIEEVLAYDDTPFRVHGDGISCLRMDEQSSVSKPLLVDYTKWVVGQPPPSEFTMNGTSAENQIVSDVDPWGKTVPHWRAFPDAISGPSGGFSISVPASPEETYRMSVFIRRDVIVGSGGGSTNFGCQSSAGKLLKAHDLSDNTDPFFQSWVPDTTEWLLFVGYCHRANSPAGVKSHKSGVYTLEGVYTPYFPEFVLPAGITDVVFRAFLSTGSDTAERQSYLYPRIDVVDGSEPSINELLAGYDSNIYDTVKASNNQPVPLSMSNSVKSEFSEIGVTRGLLGYIPFYGDIKDWYHSKLVAVNHGLNFTFTDNQTPFDGAAFTGEDGTKSISIDFDRSQFANGSGKDFTILCFVKQNTVQCRGILFELHDSTTSQSVVSVVGDYASVKATYHGVGVGEVAKSRDVAGVPSNLTWAMYAVTYSDTDKTLKLYYARYDTQARETAWGPIYPSTGSYDIATNINLANFDTIKIGHGFPAIANSYTNQGLNAIMSNFKVFGVALTREEFTIERKRFDETSSVGKGFIATHGTFNEL